MADEQAAGQAPPEDEQARPADRGGPSVDPWTQPSPVPQQGAGPAQPGWGPVPQQSYGAPSGWGPPAQGWTGGPPQGTPPWGGAPGSWGAPPPARRRWVWPVVGAVAAVLVLAAVLVAATLAVVGDDDAGDATTVEASEPEPELVPVEDAEPGQCLQPQDEVEIFALPVVPCDVAHEEEVFAVLDFPEADWPGDRRLEEQGAELCEGVFADYVGAPYEDSALYLYPITPTEKGWKGLDDRQLVCVAYSERPTLTASVRGSGQ